MTDTPTAAKRSRRAASHPPRRRQRDQRRTRSHHTHVQHDVAGIPVHVPGEAVMLERGALARIDRQILTELDHGDGVRLVKVPLSKAVWSTWRRYCQALDVTMGRAIAGLIVHELGTLVDGEDRPETVYAARLQERLVARSDALDVRERRLEEREQSLREAQHLMSARTRPLDATRRRKVGRNDPCPCGSGHRYKRCHGT